MKESTKPNPTTAESSNLVLVVEDDADKRDLITSWLRAENIPWVAAESVDTAKTLLQNEEIAVTLLDWVLDRSGAEVLAFCRENHPEMPVIVMSGQPFDVRTDAFLKEADSFLQHPLGGTVVVSHVRRWLKRLQDAPRIMLPRREEKIAPLEDIKGRYIRHVAQLLDNNASLAAKRLGIHRQTVTSVLKTEGAADAEPAREGAPRQTAKQQTAVKSAHPATSQGTGKQSRKSTKALGLIAAMAAIFIASSQAQFPVFEAEDAQIDPPYVATNGCISQPVETGVTNGGRAVLNFTVVTKGSYAVGVVINGLQGTSNSFYINIDSEPVDPLMICDLLGRTGTFTNIVSWREAPAQGTAQAGTKFFDLATGQHQLVIRGRSAHTKLDRFMIVKRPEPPRIPAPPSNLRIASGD